MTSIFDLVQDYIDRFYEDVAVDKEEKVAIHREIRRLLRRGWCAEDIQRRFVQVERTPAIRKQVRQRIGTEVRKLFNQQTPTSQNLLSPSVFYYHNALRLTSKPPKRQFNIDEGTFVRINDPYFLEMRASYTVEELVEYYARQFSMKLHRQEYSRYVGSFNWLLGMYDVELILFMIDESANMVKAENYRPPRKPMDIDKYKADAIRTRERKRSEAVVAGVNKIVRRKRTRSS